MTFNLINLLDSIRFFVDIAPSVNGNLSNAREHESNNRSKYRCGHTDMRRYTNCHCTYYVGASHTLLTKQAVAFFLVLSITAKICPNLCFDAC